MNDSTHVIDVTQSTFNQIVLENSYQQPVLVDFWAAWCQPCQILMPLLKRLAEKLKGSFILAKVNADQEQALSAQYGVRALPTVKVFRNGQAVQDLVGVQPESAYQAIIQRFQAKPSDTIKERAEISWQGGQRETAVGLLREGLGLEPEDIDLQLSLSDKLLTLGHTQEASDILNRLPLEVSMQEPASSLLARLELINSVQGAPATEKLLAAVLADPEDLHSRYLLGSRKLIEGDYEAALEQFLEIVRRDRSAGEMGRKGMLTVFGMLGSDHPLVTTYRRKMFALLH